MWDEPLTIDVDDCIENAAYIHALMSIQGVGKRSVAKILGRFKNPKELLAATRDDFIALVGSRVSDILVHALKDDWVKLEKKSFAVMSESNEMGIIPITILDGHYPPLLRLIASPPLILYVKGSLDWLRADSVAVIGTRTPTSGGIRVAERIAARLSNQGYVVVSGLARGIDAAAHKGALEAEGRTIAVMATPLNQVYPAEHKELAHKIIENGGALVGEYAIGERTHRSAFVERDRIQSGLSIAVIPVQTDIRGGTMHTVRYAEEQGRLLLCPRPLDQEFDKSQYRGIRMLIDSGRAIQFGGDDYEGIFQILNQRRGQLLQSEWDNPIDGVLPFDEHVDSTESHATFNTTDKGPKEIVGKSSVSFGFGDRESLLSGVALAEAWINAGLDIDVQVRAIDEKGRPSSEGYQVSVMCPNGAVFQTRPTKDIEEMLRDDGGQMAKIIFTPSDSWQGGGRWTVERRAVIVFSRVGTKS